ncbi:twitching motility protein PilT [Endozoicomonas sp. SM1973]|uniref:Twitching motility protein PilT n=1 Tax=Spartinivicinus marinus TaxID=2994442 RepID=A0A853I3B3_9GAMM|nr:Mut7-C RNAse domain-containing protein [Spartinivicinus marinus]MCX4025983.1 hypothetical protein [Spartinivicinus marinus]NYZ67883.1 twitching motility protein PilT [Spartinivicinus marinus]
MPLLISARAFKQQAKSIVKHWPRDSIKHATARELLAQLYGFNSHHHYINYLKHQNGLFPKINRTLVFSLYPGWIKKLAALAGINEIQAKNMIIQLWPGFLENSQLANQKMYASKIHFLGECVDLLPDSTIHFTFDDKPSIKDVIESLGLPHVEVAYITANEQSVDFTYLLKNKDTVVVHPYPHPQAIVQQLPESGPRFLLDVHLGGLLRYLRIAGFDCFYQNSDLGDQKLASIAEQQQRILLSRDIGLLKRSNVCYGRWVRNTDPLAQFIEIMAFYRLYDLVRPLTLCSKCNGEIKAVNKDTIYDQVPEGVFEFYDEFNQCQSCQQVYWKGSHYQKIQAILEKVSL